MKLLLLSNSTNAGEEYLKYPINHIQQFLVNTNKEVLFIPYAAVTFSYDKYEKMVDERFSEISIKVNSIHHFNNPTEALANASTIVIGGGNTFKLLKTIQDNNLIEPIRQRVIEDDIPYIGWSAGSNMACPTIRTTNDMPVVEPDSMNALNLIPFQINPHYQDKNPNGHAGETREQRILEFIEMNRNQYVAGLREGTMFEIIDNNVELIGEKSIRVFKYGHETREYNPGDNIDLLMY
ncbi:dipeptidase PepE [Bacteroidota bacterium]